VLPEIFESAPPVVHNIYGVHGIVPMMQQKGKSSLHSHCRSTTAPTMQYSLGPLILPSEPPPIRGRLKMEPIPMAYFSGAGKHHNERNRIDVT
jgi:hypothetical protein